MRSISIKTALLAAGMAAGALTTGMALPTAAQAQAFITVQAGPPPVRHEMVPPPRAGWVWAPGHYEWKRGRYVWVGGVWVRERPGYAYVAPAWEQQGGRWVYRQSRWDAQPRHDHRMPPPPPPRHR
jgi:hypothetical protein